MLEVRNISRHFLDKWLIDRNICISLCVSKFICLFLLVFLLFNCSTFFSKFMWSSKKKIQITTKIPFAESVRFQIDFSMNQIDSMTISISICRCLIKILNWFRFYEQKKRHLWCLRPEIWWSFNIFKLNSNFVHVFSFNINDKWMFLHQISD